MNIPAKAIITVVKRESGKPGSKNDIVFTQDGLKYYIPTDMEVPFNTPFSCEVVVSDFKGKTNTFIQHPKKVSETPLLCNGINAPINDIRVRSFSLSYAKDLFVNQPVESYSQEGVILWAKRFEKYLKTGE